MILLCQENGKTSIFVFFSDFRGSGKREKVYRDVSMTKGAWRTNKDRWDACWRVHVLMQDRRCGGGWYPGNGWWNTVRHMVVPRVHRRTPHYPLWSHCSPTVATTGPHCSHYWSHCSHYWTHLEFMTNSVFSRFIKGGFIGVHGVGVFGCFIGNFSQNCGPFRLKSDSFDKTVIFLKKQWFWHILHIERTRISKREMFCEPRPEMEMFGQKQSILTEVQQWVIENGLNRAIVFKSGYPSVCHKRCQFLTFCSKPRPIQA